MTIEVVDLGGFDLEVTDITQPELTPGLVVVAGPRGPAGQAGGSAVILDQTTPLATWTATHAIGHPPTVAVVIGGKLVLADVEYPDNSTVVVTHATPQTGLVIAA